MVLTIPRLRILLSLLGVLVLFFFSPLCFVLVLAFRDGGVSLCSPDWPGTPQSSLSLLGLKLWLPHPALSALNMGSMEALPVHPVTNAP